MLYQLSYTPIPPRRPSDASQAEACGQDTGAAAAQTFFAPPASKLALMPEGGLGGKGRAGIDFSPPSAAR